MDEERERGRIASLRVRRQAVLSHAQEMLPVVRRARSEGASTYRAVADWLNARDYKTPRGKVWRHQTVWNLFHVEFGQIEQAEEERDRAVAVIDYKMRQITSEDHSKADVLAEERAQAERNCHSTIIEAKRIGALLRCEPDTEVEPVEVTRANLLAPPPSTANRRI